MAAVTSLFKELNEKVFPDIPMGLVHGKMKPAEKEKAMRDFSGRNNENSCCNNGY